MYVKYSSEFRNPFYLFKIQSIILAAHFINISYIHFRAKMSCPTNLTELLYAYANYYTFTVYEELQAKKLPIGEMIENDTKSLTSH